MTGATRAQLRDARRLAGETIVRCNAILVSMAGGAKAANRPGSQCELEAEPGDTLCWTHRQASGNAHRHCGPLELET